MTTDAQVEAACAAVGWILCRAVMRNALEAALAAAPAPTGTRHRTSKAPPIVIEDDEAAPAPHTTDELPLPATPGDVLKRLRLARKTLIWVQNNLVNKGDLGKIVTTHCRHVLDEIGWRHEKVDKS